MDEIPMELGFKKWGDSFVFVVPTGIVKVGILKPDKTYTVRVSVNLGKALNNSSDSHQAMGSTIQQFLTNDSQSRAAVSTV